MALLGFGSVFCYGLSTSKREMKWLFFTVHKLPHWAFPAVDGVVGALFLADWLHSAVSPAAEVPPQEDAAVADAEAELAQPEAERTVVVVEADRGMSLWRHVAYFLSSVPGIVNLLLCVPGGCLWPPGG
ncbi:Uncharacterized protein SCF082_LOCUS1976 [Durusdinium trenchii]|uniref:Uncharacterized protein n=1 Tax=Durusdinium trenchii TaxID=1381693 RepID=A0ABP0HIM6_9DINO